MQINIVPVSEIVLGYVLRVPPPEIPLASFGLSWEVVSVDTDFWPAIVDPSEFPRCGEPFAELWSEIKDAYSHEEPSSHDVLVAITLPRFSGCEEMSGYADFVRMTEGYASCEAGIESWIDSRPVIYNTDSRWCRMGYDIAYAGAFKSMLFSFDPGSGWKIDVPAKRTQFGLFDSFWDAYAYSVSLRDIGLRDGWAAEETRLWPLGLWYYNNDNPVMRKDISFEK